MREPHHYRPSYHAFLRNIAFIVVSYKSSVTKALVITVTVMRGGHVAIHDGAKARRGRGDGVQVFPSFCFVRKK